MSEYTSNSLNNLKDSIEDALTVDSPQEIINCILDTLKRNSHYHRVCARHSKEALDLLHGIDKSKNVVELNASADDNDYITNPKRWPDYTELPDIQVTMAENTGLLDEDELIANGYQLTDTGWVKI